MSSLSATTATRGAAGVDERAYGLVRARRILDQQKEQPTVADRDPLEAAEGRRRAPQPGRDVGQRHTEAQAERARGERVVDVVETGQQQLHACSSLGSGKREGGAVEAAQLDLARSDVERRTGMAARRAAVVAEVPDVGRGVVVGRAAAHAVLRIGGVLERRAGDPWVVDAEHPHAVRPRPRSPT